MKRTGTPLTDNEKLMIINVHQYFSGDKFKRESHQKSSLRKRVADVLGIAEGTVGSVVSDWNSRGNLLDDLNRNLTKIFQNFCVRRF
jgi:hypothetical protein